jgi:localization factor PodJL
MRHVPAHVKGVRPAAREATGDAARRGGLSVTAAFAMIRKELQELRRDTSRPQVEPAVFEQRLHDLAAQIGALQDTAEPASATESGQDAFLRQLKALLAQNLASFQQQVATTAADAISGPAESIRRDVASLKEIQASVDRRTHDTFEAVYGTIERLVDRLSTIEKELQDRPGAPAEPASSATMPLATDDADWARLLGNRSSSPAPAAAATSSSAEAGSPDDGGAKSLILRRPAAVPDVIFDAPLPTEPRPEPDLDAAAPDAGTARPPLKLHGKIAIIGVGGALVALFAAAMMLDFYRTPPDSPGDAASVARAGTDGGPEGEQARLAEAPPEQPANLFGAVANGAAVSAARFNVAGVNTSALAGGAPVPVAFPFEPAAPADSAVWDADALMRNLMVPAPAGTSPWPQSGPPQPAGTDLAAAPLPPTIGSKGLIAAAQAGEPDAAYEVAMRFAQSRNGPDLAKAAAWMERAAQAGLAPAQFRVGAMYEKGRGVLKDLAEARRYYMQAAAQGHAKAMHNLAVLYTRGITSAPDYGAAVEWFRKAAAYGTVDSQYNLGILYARGTGVDRDLVESYKWFTVAAKGGDKDALHKRDEVAKALDPKQLETAKAAADAFVAMPQPDEATVVKMPAGGWDQAAATTKSRPTGRPERSTGK